MHKNNKENRTYEQNIKQLEYLKLKARDDGFKEWERLPGLNSFFNINDVPKHFKTVEDNVKS
jgi:hypothetical protein